MTPTSTTSPREGNGLVHAALLFRRPEQLRFALAEFIGDAAAAGEPVLVVLPGDRLDAIADLLETPGAQVSWEDMAQAGRNPGRLIPMLLDWLDGRDTRTRIVSEALWPGRSYAEAAEALRHEALLNHVLGPVPVSVLCPYDAEHLDADLIAGAELTHPQLIDEAGPRPSTVYGEPLEVARGERWPQSDPAPPVSEHRFDGDLWALRHSVAADPLLADLDPERREDLVFAVNEAATNALRHADGHACARLWRDSQRIVGEVRTRTTIDDPLAGRRHPGAGATSGRGLWLINQLCDLVEVRNSDRGLSVRMHMAGR
jgi:anti-sigma regulatory factor (Ser/Thr protein kinase)